MRVAVIGLPGAGTTTLAQVLAAQMGVRPISSMDELREQAQEDRFVVDGLPSTLEELVVFDALFAGNSPAPSILHLRASSQVRVRRITRVVLSGADPADMRGRMLHTAEFDRVHACLDAAGRLLTIDANTSRSEVLLNASAALGIQI